MQTPTIDCEKLASELQERVACFEANKVVYVGLQNQLAEVTQESQRLKQKAAELEGQANRTDASWNALAKSATIDQDKINEEIERSAKLRKDAQALRVTAEARSGIESNLIVRVAEARLKLVSDPSVINKAHWQAQLAKMFAQEGMRESLMKMFALSRALFLGSLKEHDGLLRSCNSMRERQAKTNELTWKAFGKDLEKLFGDDVKDARAP
ncbi:hypothetical protein [Pseudomonas moraviensis]|uniref:Uncharacterized protein n=1 Tax=Pseudomonas moraviensis R28-S TaxID=1395516 RepID=V8R6H2_9PSED|nr:hypothetical protein [Pseudomonas moraviensis]ETF06879.1 hypothetical protein PMO01_20370 [Pseudomonas moraviensis R28-S]